MTNEDNENNENLGQKTIKQLIEMLRPGQFSAVLGVLFVIIISAFKLGVIYREFRPIDKIIIPDTSIDNIYLIGSGAVIEYLNETVQPLYQSIANSEFKLHILKGASGTGKNLLLNTKPNINVLAMASDSILIEELTKYDSGTHFFSILLGVESLKVILVAQNTEQLNSAFPLLFTAPAPERNTISLSELTDYVWMKVPSSEEKKFDLYLTEFPSATRALYAKLFRKVNGLKNDTEEHWIPHHPWQTSIFNFVELEQPIVALSSESINYAYQSQLHSLKNQGKIVKILRVIDDYGVEQKRGLYIYGKVDKELNRDKAGYELNSSTSKFLSFLFDELSKSNNLSLDDQCISAQKNYFHIDGKSKAWVGSHGDNKNAIYRHECAILNKKGKDIINVQHINSTKKI
jgi:hypothetical protein